MTISAGGFNPPSPSFSPTPTIFEQETTGRHELQNKGELNKSNVVIVPNSQTDEVPLSHLADRNTWNYKSEAGRPSLPPAGLLRGNAPALSGKDEDWKAGYEELSETLSPELQAELLNPTMDETGTLNDVLVMGGRSMAWVDGVTTMMASENAAGRTALNRDAPVAANQNALGQVNEMAGCMQGLLEEIGPNAPFYGDSKSFVGDVQQIAQERA